MQKLWLVIVDTAEKQGLSLLLLIAAVWWFNDRSGNIEKSLNDCNEQLIEMYKTDHYEMRKVIDNNTKVIEAYLAKRK